MKITAIRTRLITVNKNGTKIRGVNDGHTKFGGRCLGNLEKISRKTGSRDREDAGR